jgi:hypothetical protein
MIISGSRYYIEAELGLMKARDYRRATRRKGTLGEAAQVRSSLPKAPGASTSQFFFVPWWSIFTSHPHLYFTGLYYAGAKWPGDLAPENT